MVSCQPARRREASEPAYACMALLIDYGASSRPRHAPSTSELPSPRPRSRTRRTRDHRANARRSALFRRNYTMLGAVFAGAFAFEMFYDSTMNNIWDKINKGRQWKDIRHKYVESEE
ncbi:ubiquinol-cytochrome C reductase [Podospora appendiculata]|uniref:Complex III subunit 9 n=1 Tax=Podospora appendiculata TaxID=314037 RepID=A0AAE0XJX3_9PEZI|nr:ubiquinol-cytochrome C reductase [Podospora appendiculata]